MPKKVNQLSANEIQKWIFKNIPSALGGALEKYFRLEVEGLEKVPRNGRVLIIPNHSGFLGLDAVLLGHVIAKNTPRIPRILTHKAWFMTKATAWPAEKLGMVQASYENGIQLLNKNRLVMLFPEGEQGNFKPSSRMYELQTFHRGFVRMALSTQSPILPVVIVGAEETNINLSQLSLGFTKKPLLLPIPVNLLPLPVKWSIKFLTPIHLPFGADKAEDRDLVNEIADEIQSDMQAQLYTQASKRR